MSYVGTNMPSYTFLAGFKPRRASEHKIETKSPKRDHIYKLCFYMLEEHNCLILNSSSS